MSNITNQSLSEILESIKSKKISSLELTQEYIKNIENAKKLVSFEEPIANSSQFNFPSKKAPLFHKFFVTVDSYEAVSYTHLTLPTTPYV